MALNGDTPPIAAPRRRGRPRKLPIDQVMEPIEDLPPRKRLRYTPGGSARRPYSRATLNSIPHTAPRARPVRRQTGSTVRRRSLITPRFHKEADASASSPRFSSAAAAATAISQNDSYKPREERSWEEFHTDLDIDAPLAMYTAEETDAHKIPEAGSPHQGTVGTPINGSPMMTQALHLIKQQGDISGGPTSNPVFTPLKRKPGRPPKRPMSSIFQVASPATPQQKITPAPIHNPKEKLVLPKPNFRRLETFAAYEQSAGVGINYVEKTFANVGYQESDIFLQPRNMVRGGKETLEDDVESSMPMEGLQSVPSTSTALNPRLRVEYDMDEQDERWLEGINAERTAQGVDIIRPQYFEIAMTLIEKEWYAMEKRIPKPNPKPPQTHRPRSSSAAAVNGETAGAEEQDTKCAVCDDGDCENTNAIVFCDGCDLAVHQECYGVPFIPEGQWLCRKCQLIGRAAGANAPSCIFCPNTEGAYKQTTNMRWSHLLCAIWIPEVSLGNQIFMEPVQDVEKVPKSRWKLKCYICQQQTGACIQCTNKTCFLAFHVTCARRCRLTLKMKNPHGQIAEAGTLKGFCDKHVTPEWRREHDTDKATMEAKAYYAREMNGRRWADSQQAALTLPDPSQAGYVDAIDEQETEDPTIAAANNKKHKSVMKKIWRMPSGAPIVPHIVFHNVENLLARWQLRKRKEFVAEACKYWTLKREARRGASLLKRLQLQLDTFTSMEITRRDFAAMGAAGGPKLQQRIEFAERLEHDINLVSEICQSVVDREIIKGSDAEILREIVDTVYFPVHPLLWQIFDRVLTLDSNHNFFRTGLENVRAKLEQRYYTNVAPFTSDLVQALNQVVYSPDAEPVGVPGGEVNAPMHKLKVSEKDKRARAKRILKTIQPDLLKAAENEADLEEKTHAEVTRAVQVILDDALQPPPDALGSVGDESRDAAAEEAVDGHSDPRLITDFQTNDFKEEIQMVKISTEETSRTPTKATRFIGISSTAVLGDVTEVSSTIPSTTDDMTLRAAPHDARHAQADSALPALSNSGSTNPSTTYHDPLTPPYGDKEIVPTVSSGGIPWYLESFEPDGTTIYDERWTGRDALRGISEELSELSDDVVDGMMENGTEHEVESEVVQKQLKVPAARPKKKARGRRNKW